MKLAPPRPERADPAPETAIDEGHGWPPLPARPPPSRPPGRARLLKGFAILLGVAGVLALADGFLTLAWQEPISGLIAHFNQARLAQSLKRLEAERATPADERALAGLPTDNQRMAFFARRLQQTARAGQAVGRIRIPRIGANFVVVAGTDESSLEKGPGIYSGTAVPGLRGTVGIAGHRTTYLAPFRRINELARGDRITLEMPYGLFSYTVLGHKIVSPNDVTVLRQASYDQVVLTACNPLYSAAQRIVVFARLTADAPAGPALAALPTTRGPAVSIPAAQAAEAILGDALTPVPVPVDPAAGIDPGAVLVGAAPAVPGRTAPVRRAPARRASARTSAPAAASTGRAIAQPPVSVPTNPSPTVQAPVVTAPRPAPPVVRRPTPTPPPAAVKAPATSPAPTTNTTAPPDSSHGQARVYGAPGGAAPIIGVPSG